jgi:hypothetical protein
VLAAARPQPDHAVAAHHHHHHQVTPCQPGSLCQSNNSTLVPKQHHQTLGERCSPPGPVPDVAAPQHTRDKDNSSKWLLKDRPTHAALQFPNQTTAARYPRTCGHQVARLPQTNTRRSWVSRAHATHSSSVCQVTTSAAVQPHVENRHAPYWFQSPRRVADSQDTEFVSNRLC